MPHRKIQAILSSAENACHMIVRKDLTGKKVKIVEIVNCKLIEYTAVVLSVNLVRIDGPRHITAYLFIEKDGEVTFAGHQLNCITVLSDNNQELSLNES